MINPQELGSLQLSLLHQVVQQRRQTYLVKTLKVVRGVTIKQFLLHFSPPSKSILVTSVAENGKIRHFRKRNF